MEIYSIDNNNPVGANNSGELSFHDYNQKIEEHKKIISQLKNKTSVESSEGLEKLKDINILKSETISPIEGVKNMQILSESEALQGLVTSLYEISSQKCNEGMQDDLVMENISRKTINSLLSRAVNGENVDENKIRQYLYKLTDNTKLYKEILNRIGGPFILGANDRGNRGGDFDGGRGIHMGVDYNLPKGEPIRLIYDGTVVAKRSGTKITGDKTVIKHINDIYGKDGGKSDNILIIEHKILGKTFYSLYIHIYDDENVSVGSTVKKGQEIGKIAGYETNGHRNPHLHFTIMKTLDSRPMISGYLNKLTVNNDEKKENIKKLYDEK